jgi:hypothetical protein
MMRHLIWFVPIWLWFQQPQSADLFIEAYISNPEPYAGQQIEYQVRFFDAVGANNPLYEAPSFEGFWRVQPDRISRSIEVRGDRQYNVTDIRTTLYPNVPGEVVIEPARVVVPETVFAAEQVFTTPQLLVRARPLPEGAPAGFSGAVGQLALEASLNTQEVRVGEPITLRLLLTGTVNVLVLPPPDITALQGWRAYVQSRNATFDTASPGLIGQQEILIVLFPSQAGAFTLPPLPFSYFDPTSNIYREISTGEIALNVLPSVNQSAAPAVVSSAPVLRPVNLNALPDWSNLFTSWVWWLIGPLTWLIALLWRWREWIEARLFNRSGQPQSPLSQARAAVRGAVRSSNPAAALQAALHTYLLQRGGVDSAISLTEAADHLRVNRLRGGNSQQLQAMIDSLSAAQFAPAQAASKGEIRQQAQQLDALLVELDAALQ